MLKLHPHEAAGLIDEPCKTSLASHFWCSEVTPSADGQRLTFRERGQRRTVSESDANVIEFVPHGHDTADADANQQHTNTSTTIPTSTGPWNTRTEIAAFSRWISLPDDTRGRPDRRVE